MNRNNLSEFLFKLSLAALIIGVGASAFAPSEKVIGKVLSLVYLHIGFFLAALILLLLNLIFQVAGLWNSSLSRFSRTSFYMAVVSWVIYFVLSGAVAYFGWGGIFWQEPRMVIAVRVVIILLAAVAVSWVTPEKWKNIVFSAASLISIVLWLNRYSIFHPQAPIRNSDVMLIKILAVVSIVSIIASMLLLTLSLYLKEEKSANA